MLIHHSISTVALSCMVLHGTEAVAALELLEVINPILQV